MLCPKCRSDDIELIEITKKREHYYCYHCKKGFYQKNVDEELFEKIREMRDEDLLDRYTVLIRSNAVHCYLAKHDHKQAEAARMLKKEILRRLLLSASIDKWERIRPAEDI